MTKLSGLGAELRKAARTTAEIWDMFYEYKKANNEDIKVIFEIMARIHEYIATVMAVVGIYLVLVYFSIFEYTARLYTYIPDKFNLLPIGLLLVLISYLVSPWVWGMVMSRIKQFAR